MNSEWLSSGHHPKMNTRVLDDSSLDESPPSDTEHEALLQLMQAATKDQKHNSVQKASVQKGLSLRSPRNNKDSAPKLNILYEVCGDTPELRSSRRELDEGLSAEYLEESLYATSSQAVPPAPADMPIAPRDATEPTRGYADMRWQQSGKKLKLRGESLTDVTRGTYCTDVHQYDTIRDAGHEYDTARGEKCRLMLLGPEERMVPSPGLQEVNTGRAHDDRLVPRGRTHISDSIPALLPLEAHRYCAITSREISLSNEPHISDIQLPQPAPQGRVHLSESIKSIETDRYFQTLSTEISLSEPLNSDIQLAQLVPQGRVHLSESIKSIETDRYRYFQTLSTEISLSEPLNSDTQLPQLVPQGRVAIKTSRYCKTSSISLFSGLPIADSHLSQAAGAVPQARAHIMESILPDRCCKISSREIPRLFQKPLIPDSQPPDITELVTQGRAKTSESIQADRCRKISSREIPLYHEPLIPDTHQLPQVTELVPQGGVNIPAHQYNTVSLREISLGNETLISSHLRECLVPTQKRCSTIGNAVKRRRVVDQPAQRRLTVDKAVQTDPWNGESSTEALNFAEACRERRVEEQGFEQVSSSAGSNDTLTLVETSAGVTTSDGACEAPGEARGLGIDLPSPAFKWDDGKLPRSESPALVSNKRMRLRPCLRLGLSKKRAPTPRLHPAQHTIRNGL